MTVENGVRIFAGTLVLISVALVYFISLWWLLFTTFVGVMLIQSALTGFCPANAIMRKLGCKEGPSSCSAC